MTGCAHNSEMPRPGDNRLVCKGEPSVPGEPGQPVTDEQDTNYKVELRGAWQDCHSAVSWLRDWFNALPD